MSKSGYRFSATYLAPFLYDFAFRFTTTQVSKLSARAFILDVSVPGGGSLLCRWSRRRETAPHSRHCECVELIVDVCNDFGLVVVGARHLDELSVNRCMCSKL